MNQNKLVNLQNEVQNIHNEILEICKTNKIIDDLYKGSQIYYSPIRERPAIMFLGINPGQGFAKKEHEKVAKFSPLENHEYIEHSYKLANSWRRIFTEDLNRLDLLSESVKSNMFFFATSGEKTLDSLLNELNRERPGFKNELFKISRAWIKTLLTEIKPEILILEGVKAFDELKYCFNKDELEIYDFDKYQGYLKTSESNIYCAPRRRSNLKDEGRAVEVLQELIEALKI